MSVAPIISVLAFSHIRKPAQHARRKLSKAARSMNVTMRRTITGGGGARKLKYSQSTVQASGPLQLLRQSPLVLPLPLSTTAAAAARLASCWSSALRC